MEDKKTAAAAPEDNEGSMIEEAVDAVVESPAVLAIRRGVSNWVHEHLHNTPFSQDTGAWNVLQEALSKLAHAIIEEFE